MATKVSISLESKEGEAGGSSTSFSFQTNPHEYPSLSGKEGKDRWVKWGHAPRTVAFRLSVLQGGRDPSGGEGGDGQAFLLDLFNSTALRECLRPLSAKGTPTPFQGLVTRVHAQRLAVGATSLAFFDPLIPDVLGVAERPAAAGGSSAPVSSSSSSSSPTPTPAATPLVWIKRRVEEAWEGMPICDNAREALVLPPLGDPEGEDPSGSAEALMLPNRFSHLFSPRDRTEFLFKAGRWVVGGGSMCQYEDEWTPYAGAVRDLARDLLTVVKGGPGGGVAVATQVWQIRGVEGEGGVGGEGSVGCGREFKGGGGLFPLDSPHNVCWVCADPIHRVVHVLHSSYVPFW